MLNPTVRKFFKSKLTSVGLATLLTISFHAFADESLTVVSWGGSYEKACLEGYFKPFEAETGIKVRVESYSGGLAPIRAQVESDNIQWDVVDIESQDLIIGCDEGLIETLEDVELPPGPNGEKVEDDFLPGSIMECGVPTLSWATIVAYNKDMFEENPPSTIQDFFDLEKYPGKRGMRRTPEVNLEFALMADGVPTDQVYEVLNTEAGVDRAFAKLDTIKDEVIFWNEGSKPPHLLADQQVVMTTAYNGRIFNAQTVDEKPFVIIWDGQVRDFARWVIVAGTPNYENAKKFVEFAARSSSMAGVANRISYGPVRLSAWSFVDKHVTTNVDMRPHMPTSPNNTKNVLDNDAEWWSEYKDELTERFSTWLSR